MIEQQQPVINSEVLKYSDQDIYQTHLLDQLNPVLWKNIKKTYLSGTGFSISSQIEKLKREYKSGFLEGLAHQQLLDTWLKQTRQDIISFKIEYLIKGLVLPNPQVFSEIDGKKRIVGDQYGSQPVLEMISKDERQGAVWASFAQIEAQLVKAPIGTVAFFTSPAGWSDLKTDQGREIEFPDTQTYLWRVKDNGELEAATIVSDMSLKENQNLLESFDIGRDRLRGGNFWTRMAAKLPINTKLNDQVKREEIVKVVQNMVLLSPSEALKYDFTDVVGRMRQVKKNNLVFKGQSFETVYQNLNRLSELMNLDESCESVICDFEAFVKGADPNSEEFLDQIAGKLSETVIKVSRAVRGKDFVNLGEADIREETSYIGERSGCNGGGASEDSNEEIVVMTEFGPRRIKKYFNCPREHGGCGKKIEAGKGITRCPHLGCGLESSKIPNRCA